eukprot:gb/GEZN01010963.1/.p1 GENE.gb/GEZN01010963.1/~~gb/GEZN01010963.1/.p1  ORF type:complete len:338 (+),score=15.76 gb/GEZN01010963.1/:93-1106(+)
MAKTLLRVEGQRETDQVSHQSKTKHSHSIISGGFSGLVRVVSKTACAPFERIKILNQLGESHGMLNSAREIWRHEGLRGFWVGNATNCARAVPATFVLFSSQDILQMQLQRAVPNKSYVSEGWISATSGTMAGFLAVIVTYPMDVARTRMTGRLTQGRGPNFFQVLSNSLKQEGFFSWYRGMQTTLLGVLPVQGIKFGVYGALSRLHQQHSDLSAYSNGSKDDSKGGAELDLSGRLKDSKKPLNAWQKLLDGAAAGVVSQTVMFPNDTVRRRLQLQGIDGSPILYSGTLHCYRTLYAEGGIRIFYRGLCANVIRVAPGTAITFASFGVCKDLLARYE